MLIKRIKRTSICMCTSSPTCEHIFIDMQVWNMQREMIITAGRCLKIQAKKYECIYLFSLINRPAHNSPGSESRIISNFGVSPAALTGQELTYILRGV